MLVGFLLLLSGSLIGAGFALVLRDWVKRKRASFLAPAPVRVSAPPAEEAEIIITRPGRAGGIGNLAAPPTRTQAMANGEITTPTFRERTSFEARRVQPIVPPAPAPKPAHVEPAQPSDTEPTAAQVIHGNGAAGAPLPPTEWQTTPWPGLHRRVLRALEQVQAQTLPTSVEIATEPSGPDDASGATFPVRLAGREEGWLHIELESDGWLSARLTLLADEGLPEPDLYHRLAPDQQTDADIEQLVSASLGPLLARAAARAARPRVRVAASTTPAPPPPEDEPDAQAASEHAWHETARALSAALRATNGAFAQIATRLIEIDKPQWDPVHQRHRQTLALVVAGEDAARMHVDRLAHEFEISVAGIDTGSEQGTKDVKRRRRVPTDGITVQALAELIAGCAWPTIARVRDRATSAPPA